MKKALVFMLAVLLLGTVGIARTDVFDVVIIEGTVAFTGTTIELSPSTSFAVYSPLIYFGYDAGARMLFTIDDTTGDIAITHTGSNKAVTWTVPELTIAGNFTVDGTTTTIDTVNLTVEDKNIILANVTSPTDTTADGGGFTLKGATDKTITWDNTNDNWTFNQAMNLVTGLDYKINNVSVLNATTLGSSVVTSSITSAGTIATGTWEADVIDHERGGLEADVNAYDGLVRITGGSTSAVAVSANVLTFLGSANFAAMVTNLSLTIGTNTQAWDTDLDTWATLTPTADAQTLVESTNFASMAQDLSLEIGVDTQAYDADLGALAGVTSAANAIPYFTGSATADVISSSANVVSFLGSANTAAMITALSLTIGTNTQAWDTDLDTFATLTPTANAQTLLESTNFLSMTQDLSVEIGVDTQAYDADLGALAGVTSAANAIPYFTGSATADVIGSSANVISFLGAANTAAMITALSLTIGTNTQAWDADLDTYAGITPTADAQTLLASTNFLSMTQDLSVEIGVDTQAYDADLDTFATLTPTANAQTLLESTNFLSMTQDLSVEIGVDVQAYDGDLDTWATLTPTANAQTLVESTNFLSMTQDLSVEIGVDTQAYHANLDAFSISDNQAITEYVAFDIEEATMDADDGSGIKIASVDVNATGVILAAFVNVTQGYSEASDTIELVIGTSDDLAGIVTTLVGAVDTSSPHLLAYQPVTGATVIGATTTTNRYVVVGYKDVGNDDNTGANLQGTLIVIYLEQ